MRTPLKITLQLPSMYPREVLVLHPNAEDHQEPEGLSITPKATSNTKKRAGEEVEPVTALKSI